VVAGLQAAARRVVVSPAQARSLIAAVRALGDWGQHLEAFFACPRTVTQGRPW
jgi:hypothetical protein